MADTLQSKLIAIMVGGCTCDTKTPELKFHKERCHFRLASEALDMLPQQPMTHVHHKTSGRYREVARGALQTAQPLTDLTELVAYQGADGRWWFRPPSEFDDDERFGRLDGDDRPNDLHDDLTPGADPTDRAGVKEDGNG